LGQFSRNKLYVRLNMPLPFSIRAIAVIGAVVAIAFFSVASCGKRQTLRVASTDGSCTFHCVQKERIIKTGKYGGWLFSDSEPDWVAVDALMEIDGVVYKLPSRLVSKIAKPNSIRNLAVERSSEQTTVSFHGGEGAGGMWLALRFVGGKLEHAEADTVASDRPWVVYP